MDAKHCEQLLNRLINAPPVMGDRVSGLGPHAAVLVGVATKSPGCPVIFTRRAKKMRNHPDEICLPGGLVEPYDRGLASRTALREAEEEIGLEPHQVEVIRIIPSCRTSQGLTVIPVLGKITPPGAWRLQAREVSEVLEVPLKFFLEPANFQAEERYYRGVLRNTLSLKYKNRCIWGLTARVMRELQLLLTN